MCVKEFNRHELVWRIGWCIPLHCVGSGNDYDIDLVNYCQIRLVPAVCVGLWCLEHGNLAVPIERTRVW